MKQFKSQIFMGASNPGSSEANILKLYRLIDEACSLISSLQQNGGMGYAFDEKSDSQGTLYLDRIAEDIVMALTGKQITLSKCAYGGKFGVSTDELAECITCAVWTECVNSLEEKDSKE